MLDPGLLALFWAAISIFSLCAAGLIAVLSGRPRPETGGCTRNDLGSFSPHANVTAMHVSGGLSLAEQESVTECYALGELKLPCPQLVRRSIFRQRPTCACHSSPFPDTSIDNDAARNLEGRRQNGTAPEGAAFTITKLGSP